MIAQLTGTVARTEGNSIVLDVSGVGYQVFVPATVLSALPEAGVKFTLMTHLIVREDEMTLYGFANQTEMQAFKILLGVSGVGPKVALALLSTLEVPDLARALSTSDTRAITKVPGVGPKLAQRLCLELGDKMAAFAFEKRTERAAAGTKTAQENAAYEDVIEALLQFGYSRPDARKATDRVVNEAADRTDVGALVTAALRWLTAGQR
jgi:holliday junction DNA helicase RuvA